MATGLEILGGISAVVQLLQTTIDIADRIKSAKDKKHTQALIKSNRKEVASLKDIVAIVDKEETLRTQAITAEIAEIAVLAQNLEDLLNSMENANFATAFIHGKDQKAELTFFTGEIVKLKSNLMLKIQSAHVGLTILANQKCAAQVQKIESVDAMLRKLISDFEGLLIADIVTGKEPGADGTVILEERDLEELGVEMNKDAYHQDVTLITKDNLTYDQSLQINGPIGNEGFIAPKYAEILNNVARGQSCQINYAISTKQWNEAREQQLAVVDKIFVQGKLGKEEMVQVLQNQNNSAQPDNDRVRQGKIERSQEYQRDKFADK